MNSEGSIVISEDGRLILNPLPPRARHSPSTGLRRREQNLAALDTATVTSTVEGDQLDTIKVAISAPDNDMSAAQGGAINQAEIDKHDEMDLDTSHANDNMLNDHPMSGFDHEASLPPTKSKSKAQKDQSPASAALKSLAARNSNFDRASWLKRVKYPSKGAFSIGSVLEHLGLKRSQTGTNFSFKNKTVSKLAQTL